MQIPGSSCEICGETIVIAPDGTWCSKCSSVFHTSCLAEADSYCPTCRKEHTPPDEDDLVQAQGRAQRPLSHRSSSRVGALAEIVTGAALLICPVAILFFGFGARFGGSSGGLAIALILSVILLVAGVMLVVDGQNAFRNGR